MEIRLRVDEQLKRALDDLVSVYGAAPEDIIRAAVLDHAQRVSVPELSRQVHAEWAELYDRLDKS